MMEMGKSYYPELEIHLDHIHDNARILIDQCAKSGIQVAGVVKGFNGMAEVAGSLVSAGCHQLASSRLEQLAELKGLGIKIPMMLIRIPSLSELHSVVDWTEISLQSEWSTLERLEKICKSRGVEHKAVLMMDVGDLREGYFDGEELLQTALRIENEFSYVKLAGIGTNMGCYGSVVPTAQNLGLLCQWAERIEGKIGRALEIISGGSSTTLPLLYSGQLPKRINHLRIGEAILNNRDLPDLWGSPIDGMHQKTFILKAQVVEVKEKPSHPIGELYLDAFGNKPIYEDIGMRRRALVAVGKQDLGDASKLIPLQNGISIIGSSSDHCILDVSDADVSVQVGDILEFSMFYQPMLFLTASKYVKKTCHYL